MRVTLTALTVLTLLAPVGAQQPAFLDTSAAAAIGTSVAATPEAKAIDEMLLGKSGRQHRWTRRPALVVMQTVLQFQSGQHDSYVALEGEVSNADAQRMAADLRDGLKILTSGVYDSFASVSFERARPGAMVDVDREGVIVAGRFEDVMTKLKAAGFGGRIMKSDNTITSGTVILDEEYDRTGSRRRLLRIHELGHALGYNHVNSQRSIMNPMLGSEPTDLDRRAFTLAFQAPTPSADAP